MNHEYRGEPRGAVIQRVTVKLEDENTAGDYTGHVFTVSSQLMPQQTSEGRTLPACMESGITYSWQNYFRPAVQVSN